MKNWFKKILIPSGETSEVVAYKSWVVRWMSVDVDWSNSYGLKKEQSEIFPSKEDAEKFVDALKSARRMLKDCGVIITIEENQSKLASIQQ